MSVRVNLLPEDVQARGRANRSRILAGVLGLLLLLALGAATLLQRSSIQDAEQRLAEVESTNQSLQADIAALQPFADLETRAGQSVEVVGAALATEGSLATILQDLSAVLPPNAELTNLSIVFSDEPAGPSPGGTRVIHGQLTATGRVLDGVAPGVERLIIDLERVAAFENPYVTTSTVDDEGVATFVLEVELGPEVLTTRYTPEAAEAPVGDGETTP